MGAIKRACVVAAATSLVLASGCKREASQSANNNGTAKPSKTARATSPPSAPAKAKSKAARATTAPAASGSAGASTGSAAGSAARGLRRRAVRAHRRLETAEETAGTCQVGPGSGDGPRRRPDSPRVRARRSRRRVPTLASHDATTTSSERRRGRRSRSRPDRLRLHGRAMVWTLPRSGSAARTGARRAAAAPGRLRPARPPFRGRRGPARPGSVAGRCPPLRSRPTMRPRLPGLPRSAPLP